MTSTPDALASAARDVALAALAEITRPETVGEPAGYTVAPDGTVSLRFANTMPGYPGWFWTVSVAALEDATPTVLEVELLPGGDALLAPDWVPWAVRLAEYRAAQQAADESGDTEEDDDTDDDDESDEDDDTDEADELSADLADVDDLDAADFDEDGSPHLDEGDVDGVELDEPDDEPAED